MELVQKLEHAVAAKDASKLPQFKAEAEAKFVPLRASGQKNYIRTVEGLLKQLEDIANSQVRVHPLPTTPANPPAQTQPLSEEQRKAIFERK